MPNSLPVISCHGCGVCCLHMGYPAFAISIEEQLETDADDADVERPESRNQASPDSAADRDRQIWSGMPDYLRDRIRDAIRDYKPSGKLDGPCIWLDMQTRLCQHHEHRPDVCREFEAGSRACQDWRRTYASKLK